MVVASGLQEHVIFKNGVPYELVPDYINAADLCFCLKRPELDVTSPNRLFEYVCCKRVAVVTNSYKNYFNEFNSLIYVDPDNVTAIADVMESSRSITASESLEHDHDRVIKNYSWNAVVDRLLLELRI
jgi:glycosyltransferase involved in cell wall biosynthesis